MKPHEVLKKLRAAGIFTFDEGKNHTNVRLNGMIITQVPRHKGKELKTKTLKSIEEATGIKL